MYSEFSTALLMFFSALNSLQPSTYKLCSTVTTLNNNILFGQGSVW